MADFTALRYVDKRPTFSLKQLVPFSFGKYTKFTPNSGDKSLFYLWQIIQRLTVLCGSRISYCGLAFPSWLLHLSQRHVDMITPSFSVAMTQELAHEYPRFRAGQVRKPAPVCFRFWHTQSNSGITECSRVVHTPPNSLFCVPLFARLL